MVYSATEKFAPEEYLNNKQICSSEFTILTMSRGDEKRITDWLLYHHQLGFNRFIILLDNPNDSSEELLKRIAQEHNIRIDFSIVGPMGPYFHGCPKEEFDARNEVWLKENAEELSQTERVINNPLSWRQYHYFPKFLQELVESQRDGWVSLIDVDEYIVLEEHSNIAKFVLSFDKPRIRLNSYNFDMSDWDGKSQVRSFTTRR